MWHLEEHGKEILRSFGVTEYLPLIKVYEDDDSDYVHLDPSCTKSKPQNYDILDVMIDYSCRACEVFETFKMLETVSKELTHLYLTLFAASETEDLGKDIYGTEFQVAERIFYRLEAYHEVCLHRIVDSVYLYPLAEKLEKVTSEALRATRLFLRSTNGQKVVLEEVTGAGKHVLTTKDALEFAKTKLFVANIAGSKLSGFDRILVESYGRELVPGKFFVDAPTLVLASLLKKTTFSLVQLNKDTSDEVISMALALWEPHAETSLGNAQKALETALLLTTEVKVT